MRKLNEEQAEWLIQQFNLAHANLMKKPAEGMFHIMDCRAIINECTKKEFPTFQWLDPEDSDNFVQLLLFCPGDISSQLVIRLNIFSGYMNLFASEFLQFADGVAKIKEWLEHQNER